MKRAHTARFVTKAQHDALCDLLENGNRTKLTPRVVAALIGAGLVNRRWWEGNTDEPMLTERGEAYVRFQEAAWPKDGFA